jgi:hypothetical protein
VALLAAPGLLGPSALAGCTQLCNGLGWQEGLVVGFESPAELGDGTYQVFVEPDGADISLGFDIFDGFRLCLPRGDVSCEAEVVDGEGRRLHVSLAPGPRSVGVIMFYTDDDGNAGGPEVARIRILYDGVTLADETVEPTYEQDEPNGEGCGVRTHAHIDLPLAPPQSQPGPLPPGPPR